MGYSQCLRRIWYSQCLCRSKMPCMESSSWKLWIALGLQVEGTCDGRNGYIVLVTKIHDSEPVTTPGNPIPRSWSAPFMCKEYIFSNKFSLHFGFQFCALRVFGSSGGGFCLRLKVLWSACPAGYSFCASLYQWLTWRVSGLCYRPGDGKGRHRLGGVLSHVRVHCVSPVQRRDPRVRCEGGE